VISLPAAAIFVVMAVAGSQGFTTLMSAVLHSRRGRDLAVFVIMGIGLASFGGYQLVRTTVDQMGVATAALSHPLDYLWWLVPPVATAHAVTAAWDGRWLEAVVAVVVALAWTLLLVVGWERVLRWLLVPPRQDSAPATARRKVGFSRGRWEVPFIVARKELRFYLRDPRQRLVWTGTVIFVGLAIAAIVVGSAGLARFQDRHWLPMVAPVLVLMVGLPIALNQFGWERNAASYLFALPARPRAVIM